MYALEGFLKNLRRPLSDPIAVRIPGARLHGEIWRYFPPCFVELPKRAWPLTAAFDLNRHQLFCVAMPLVSIGRYHTE